ncbi:uncharacterized protein LOC144582558 isoform X2 [Callithrix jacchus]
MSLTARVSCSMLSCFGEEGPPAWSTSKPRICSPPQGTSEGGGGESSGTGMTTPVSLLASMMLTRLVVGRTAARIPLPARSPWTPGQRNDTAKPITF